MRLGKASSGKSRKYLEKMKIRLGSEGIKVKTESLEGTGLPKPSPITLRKKAMDMIVIATHGYTGMKKMMFGSVALEVFHESHMPVLLIRPESCRA